MQISSNDFRVPEGDKVNLRTWPTNVKPMCKSKKHYKELLEEHVAQLSSLQRLHYASNRYAVLLIFQAMDAAGKDGAIRHVMSGVNPQGCQVFSFKHPSATELLHDFLWRTTRDLPERGRIGIFNRSYYEEVLIARVHPGILRSEGLPDALLDEKAVWHDRYRSIVDLERHLHGNGTRIIKFYLHISKEEQRKRFLERIDEPEKNWKFSLADIGERVMSMRELVEPRSNDLQTLTAAIFDVDGVLLASPHEQAWREALIGFAEPARFTTAMYQAHVAGKPRFSGARAALEALGVPDAEKKAVAYAERKQKRLEELVRAGSVAAFPDALRFVQAVGALGWPMAVASSSKNANAMMRQIRLDSGQSLFDIFRVNVCGRDLRQGKPNPEIFLLAAAELRVVPAHCFVAEDAPAGIEAAKAGGMTGLGVARLGDAVPLGAVGADLVVTSLDEVAIDALVGGRLCRRPT
jgi:PPK2 family polyphosphate:nucleotide phosphotransferase